MNGGSTVTADYYLDGLSRSVNDGYRITQTSYDGGGAPVSSVQNAQSGSLLSNQLYEYGDAGLPIDMASSVVSNRTTTWSFDAGGRMVGETDPNGLNVAQTFNTDDTLAARVLGPTAGGTTASWCYTYDGLHRQLTQTSTTAAPSCTPGTVTAATLSYSYDAGNRLSSFTQGVAAPVTYTWNADADRTGSTDASGAAHAFSYTADDAIASDRTAPSGGSATTLTYTYSPFGGVATDGCTTYAYDGFDRLASATPGAAAGCPTPKPAATYAYDGLDRQTSHTEGSATTALFYAGLSSVVSTESSTVDTAYELGPAGQHQALTNLGTPATTEYLTQDGHGNVGLSTSGAGAVTCGTRYDPFGQQLAQGATPLCVSKPTQGGNGTTFDDFLYRDGRQDQTTSQYQFGSRSYDPAKAAFLQPDGYRTAPTGASIGLGTDPLTRNTYGYVNGDPINLVDPNGHDPHWQDEPGYRGHYNPGAGTLDAADVTVYGGTPMQTTIAPWRGNVCLDRCTRDYWGKSFSWNPDWQGTSFWDCSPRAGGSSCTDESHTYAFNGQQGWGITEYNDEISSGVLGQLGGIKDTGVGDIRGALSWCTGSVLHAGACVGIGSNPLALGTVWLHRHPPDYVTFQFNFPEVVPLGPVLSHIPGVNRIPGVDKFYGMPSFGATVDLHNGHTFINPGVAASTRNVALTFGWVPGAGTGEAVDDCIRGASAGISGGTDGVTGGIMNCNGLHPGGPYAVEVGLGMPGGGATYTCSIEVYPWKPPSPQDCSP